MPEYDVWWRVESRAEGEVEWSRLLDVDTKEQADTHQALLVESFGIDPERIRVRKMRGVSDE